MRIRTGQAGLTGQVEQANSIPQMGACIAVVVQCPSSFARDKCFTMRIPCQSLCSGLIQCAWRGEYPQAFLMRLHQVECTQTNTERKLHQLSVDLLG